MSSAILTVTQVNRFLKSLIEGDRRLSDILISGEVSNLTINQRSGHMYFSLKDNNSLLRGIMYQSAVRRLAFRPADGMRVIIRGRVSVYEPGGQYQLVAESIQPDGIGALSMAFEQLKEKLSKEGLFDPNRKRSLPPYPMRIGVITSPTGAAIQDILQIISRRWPIAQVLLCPAQVQGEAAPGQLTAGVKRMNALPPQLRCDVLIIGRGGGSLEDLWAFNHEDLARAVAASETPIISAVGHEIDFTICDFAADLRAPTPSAAAELCTPDIQIEMQRAAEYREYFTSKTLGLIAELRQRVDQLTGSASLKDRFAYIHRRREALAAADLRLRQCGRLKLDTSRAELALLCGKLDAMSPLKVLARGYGVIFDSEGRAVRDLSALEAGAKVSLMAEQGRRDAALL